MDTLVQICKSKGCKNVCNSGVYCDKHTLARREAVKRFYWKYKTSNKKYTTRKEWNKIKYIKIITNGKFEKYNTIGRIEFIKSNPNLTLKELAEKLNVSKQAVQQFIDRHKLVENT